MVGDALAAPSGTALGRMCGSLRLYPAVETSLSCLRPPDFGMILASDLSLNAKAGLTRKNG
jgi:hypothetical protein